MQKITLNNYTEAIKQIDVTKLPKELKESHYFILENADLYETDKDSQFYDEDINKYIDLGIELINKFIEKTEKPTEAEKPKAVEKPKETFKMPDILTKIMPIKQQQFLKSIKYSEYEDILQDLEKIAKKIPSSNDNGENTIMYLHYFYGNMDWYIAEWDKDEDIYFGFANIGDDQNAEFGTVFLSDLVESKANIELDFHFTPTEIKNINVGGNFYYKSEKKAEKVSKPAKEVKSNFKVGETLLLPVDAQLTKFGVKEKIEKGLNVKLKKRKVTKIYVENEDTRIVFDDKYDTYEDKIIDILNELSKKPAKEPVEKENVHKFHYQLLSRLVQDCDYFLGNGNGAEKHLHQQNVKDQIKEMKRLWNLFPKSEKPEWLSLQQIDDYEKQMNEKIKSSKKPAKAPKAKKINFKVGQIWFGANEGPKKHIQIVEISKNQISLRVVDEKGNPTDKYADFDVIRESHFRDMCQDGIFTYIKTVKIINKKAEKPAKETPAKQQTDLIPIEVTYIRSFLKLDNTKTPYEDIRRRLSKMQKDVVLKKIRKTSKYAEAINKIQESYVFLIQKMNKENTKSTEITISEATKKLLQVDINIQESPEIKVIKGFLNLYATKTKKTIRERAKTLYDKIVFLIDKKIVTTASAHYTEIKTIQTDLKKYLDSKTDKMEVESYALNGLEKIMQTHYATKQPSNGLKKKELLNGDIQMIPEKTNSEKAFDDVKTYVDMVIDGTQPALIISGPAGIGKTHMVKERLKQKHAQFVYIKGRATAAALYVTLYENNGKTLIFDDCDSIIKSGNEDAINILKAVLDSYDTRTVSWLAVKKPILDATGEPIPNTFVFDGEVIFLTNIPLVDIKKALTSRCFVAELNLTVEEIIQKMQTVLPTLDTDAPLYLRQTALNTIIDLYKSGTDIELNMRTLLKAIRIMQTVKETDVAARMIAQQCATIK